MGLLLCTDPYRGLEPAPPVRAVRRAALAAAFTHPPRPSSAALTATASASARAALAAAEVCDAAAAVEVAAEAEAFAPIPTASVESHSEGERSHPEGELSHPEGKLSRRAGISTASVEEAERPREVSCGADRTSITLVSVVFSIEYWVC